MGQRGRKSASELTVVSNIGVTGRPIPPANLAKVQKEEWNRVVNRLPPDWFPAETHSILSAYCQHYSAHQWVGTMVEKMQARPLPVDDPEDATDYFDLDAYDKLLKMQERESRAMIAGARSLRFTLQASYDKEKKKGKAGNEPWLT